MARSPDDLLPLKPDVMHMLLALASEPLHGYGIIREVDERSGGQVLLQTGALYRLLREMLRDGVVKECERPKDAEGTDERRRYYMLTAFGEAVLDAEVARMARLVRAARQIADGKRPRLA